MKNIVKGDLVVITNSHMFDYEPENVADALMGVVVDIYDEYDGFDKIPIDETAVKVYSSGMVNWYWLQQLILVSEWQKRLEA